MRNLSCGSGLEPSSKFRHHLTHASLYQNVPRGTLRPIAMDYTLPNCLGRRSASAASIIHPHHSLWQERHHLRTPMSCIGVDRKPPSSRGRICSIVLAIASFIVLVIVLAIAGLALYMGISNTESPTNAIISFGCSAKIIKGDRFIGNLKEKAEKYKRQIEALYQRSALGPALLSCTVDRFGKDGATIFFKLTFNRRKLVENLTNIEKAIRDIFLSDAFSKKPIFRNIRFDSKSILVKHIQEGTNVYSAPSTVTSPPPLKSNVKSSKMGVVLKSSKNNTVPHTTTSKPIIKDEPEFNEEDLPVIQGSFKISKTEADITEKKTEASAHKSKIEKTTSSSVRKTTFKESSITSALYKIAGDKPKITGSTSSSSSSSSTVTTPVTSPQTLTTATSTSTTVKSTTVVTEPIKEFKGSPEIYNDEPWIPILPNMPVYSSEASPPSDYNPASPPAYTSFTNPGLSYHFREAEQLGTTGIKIHPIPVNKIPVTKPFSGPSSTEPSKKNQVEIIADQNSEFVKLDTIKYQPELNADSKGQHGMKNISSIFYNLASTLDEGNVTIEENEDYEPEIKDVAGQGHVEVVEVDMDELLGQTTKIPLVTLLPVRSNSGIGRPFNRKRFGDTNNLSVENRSFPSHAAKQSLESFEKPRNKTNAVPDPVNISSADNYQIMGILNFATEGYNREEQNKQQDIVRFPKMEQDIIRNSSRHPLPVHPASNFLSPEQIRQLSQISKINNNQTYFQTQSVISTKAISSSYSNGLKVLTKTFNRIQSSQTKNDNTTYSKMKLNSDCDKFSFKCGDGKCLPESTKCNQLIDCADESDEKNCNCADYLKSQLLLNKVCDGVVDCWDFSDENQCEWCTPDQYVCSNSKVCISEEKICDGVRDCPQGDDERQCVTIANDTKSASEFPYYAQGFLMVRKHGQWGKLCVDNFQNVLSKSSVAWEITDLGKAICKSMTYQKMKTIESIEEKTEGQDQRYFELTYSMENSSRSNLSFKETYCPSKKVVRVTCQSLECGARPQSVKHIARVVGGGNAELGAWPWQVALYKEGEFQCGATLISDRWLVSAGHCFYRSPNEHWVARLGALRRGTTLPSPYEQLRTISRIIVHPGYMDFGFINDISLLEMSSSVVFSDYVRPVCVPSSDQVLEDGRICTVIGWGQLFEVGRIFPDTLQEVQVPVISTAECRKRTLFLPLYKITEDMFCAGYERGGRDACLGDSGGPLMCSELNGRWTLYGITSNGYGCARANRPGVYTKVTNYIDWINSYVHGDDSRLKNITKITTSCAGHRCPLGECLPENRLCNGFIECSDASDEKNCQKSS